MKIIEDFPPNIDELRKALKLSGKEIFCWGNTIYNPSGAALSEALIEHERVHSQQQGDDIEGWWRKYIDDPKFRFLQELEAHIVEYVVFCRTAPNRNARRVYLRRVSSRLASPMYGRVCTAARAKKAILDEIKAHARKTAEEIRGDTG